MAERPKISMATCFVCAIQLGDKMKKEYIDHYGNDSLPHLMLASARGCHIFATTNKALLKDRKELEKKFKIKIRTPKEINDECEARKNEKKD